MLGPFGVAYICSLCISIKLGEIRAVVQLEQIDSEGLGKAGFRGFHRSLGLSYR